MLPITDSFEFDYFGSDIVYGRNCVDRLDTYLSANDLRNALVVCGSNVGANDDVIEPLRRGLGDRFAGVFDGTTPEKSIESVFEGIDRMDEEEADVLVGVGGGSSLDVARFMSVVRADGRSRSELRRAAWEGRLDAPDPGDSYTPVIVIPTTFAGADISDGGSVEVLTAAESPTEFPVRLGGTKMPRGMFYDPELFEATPTSVLAGSAMNGFNKGLEKLYVPRPNPIGDSTAIHGIRLTREAFPKLVGGSGASAAERSEAMDRAVIGMILVQFQVQISIVHAVAHGFTRRYPVQQGLVHGILVPHVLRYVFERVDARRALIAAGLDVHAASLTDDETADAIVDEVIALRDSLGLPIRLRELDPVDRADFPEIAAFIPTDSAMGRAPPGLDATEAELEAVLQNAW